MDPDQILDYSSCFYSNNDVCVQSSVVSVLTQDEQHAPPFRLLTLQPLNFFQLNIYFRVFVSDMLEGKLLPTQHD